MGDLGTKLEAAMNADCCLPSLLDLYYLRCTSSSPGREASTPTRFVQWEDVVDVCSLSSGESLLACAQLGRWRAYISRK